MSNFWSTGLGKALGVMSATVTASYIADWIGVYNYVASLGYTFTYNPNLIRSMAAQGSLTNYNRGRSAIAQILDQPLGVRFFNWYIGGQDVGLGVTADVKFKTYLKQLKRAVDSDTFVTLNGTVTNNDTITLDFGVASAQITAQTGNTMRDLIIALAAAVNAESTLSGLGVVATAVTHSTMPEAAMMGIDLNGNALAITSAVGGSATEVVGIYSGSGGKVEYFNVLQIVPEYQSTWNNTTTGAAVQAIAKAQWDAVQELGGTARYLASGREADVTITSPTRPQTFTITGSVTATDKIRLTVRNKGLPGGEKVIDAIAQGGDTTTNLATRLRDAVNGDSDCAALLITATASTNVTTVTWPTNSPTVFKSTSRNAADSGAGTETVTQGAVGYDGFHQAYDGLFAQACRVAQGMAHIVGMDDWGQVGPQITQVARDGAVLTLTVTPVSGAAIGTKARAWPSMGSGAFGNEWDGVLVSKDSFATCLPIASTGFDGDGNPIITLASDPEAEVDLIYLDGMPHMAVDGSNQRVVNPIGSDPGWAFPQVAIANSYANPLYELNDPAFYSAVGTPVMPTFAAIRSSSGGSGGSGSAVDFDIGIGIGLGA